MSDTFASTPELSLLHTFEHPSTGSSRSWQSKAHPDPSIPLLATASADKSVNIWSLKDFSLISTISGGHKRSVRTVAWKDYGSRAKGARKSPVVLGTGSFDANVGIWVWNDERRSQHDGDGLTRKDDDDALEQEITEEDEEEWHFSTLLTGPDSEIKSIAFSPAQGYPGSLLATSSRDKSVWVWEEVEPEEWETIAVLSEHTGDVKCVGWCEGAKRRKRRKVSEDVEMTDGNTNQHDEDEDVFLGCRPLLASGSYDDTIRLWRDVEEEGDWICVAVISQHEGTVWDVKFEPNINYSLLDLSQRTTKEQQDHARDEFEAEWQPRLVSCSDDQTVRIWHRILSSQELAKRRAQISTSDSMEPPTGFAGRIPSVIRPMSAMENWEEEATLPTVHVRSIYAVDWSARTGLIVSCGGEGTIAVYREVLASGSLEIADGDMAMDDPTSTGETTNGDRSEAYKLHKSKWAVVALIEAGHDEYEVNHVCWAARRDNGRRFEGEEVIVSTGDEGDVRIWALPEQLLKDLEKET